MKADEAAKTIRAIKIDGPTLILIDQTQIDMDALALTMAGFPFEGINKNVLVIGVDGAPSLAQFTIEQIEQVLRLLKRSTQAV
jgi:hypothetical protein